MMTIINAAPKYGYSGYDHMIDDMPAKGAVGRRARSVAEARRIVARAAKPGIPARCACVPVWFEAALPDGRMIQSEVWV